MLNWVSAIWVGGEYDPITFGFLVVLPVLCSLQSSKALVSLTPCMGVGGGGGREHCVSPARVAVKETNIASKPCERCFFLWWEPVSFYRRNPHNPECWGQGCLSSFLFCWPIQLTETRGVSYLMNLSVTTDRRQFTLFYLFYFSFFLHFICMSAFWFALPVTW